ncbi:MAG: ATP-binding protein, partial [Aggregatilineales bacterium]
LLETRATRESFLQAARFVGRDTELSRLNDALVAAAESRGSVWLIGGESGVGKSRLLGELHTQALLRGALVLRGQAVAEGGIPYQLWRDAIRRLSLQTELTDFEATVLKLLVPDIERLLAREVSDTPQVDAQSLQLRLFSVIESMLRQQRHLIVLLLEDLQWADDSLALLKRLNDLASQSPLLIVGSYRNDERPTLPTELPMLRHIKLERLPPASIELLSESMLGEVGKSQPVIDLLKRETEGNVFFIVEVVRTLAEESGQLADIGRKTLPDHVFAGGMQTVIRRRLDWVPESARQLMIIAAVAGREVDLKILQTIVPTVVVDEWLQQVATVIEVQDNRYRFAHDKLREGILASLAADDRRFIHRDIAQAIETAYPDAAEHYAALAYHWGQAQNGARTIHNATLAGQQALRSGSYREAIQFFEQALALTDRVQLDNRQLSDLYHLLGEAQWGQSDMAKSREWHGKALALLSFSVPEQPRQLALGTLKPLVRHIGRRIFRIQRQAHNPEELLIAAKSFDQIMQGSYHDANFLLGVYSIFSGMDAAERAGDSLQAVRLQARYYNSLAYATGDAALHRVARSYFSLAQNRLKVDADPETLAWFDLAYGIYLAGFGQWEQSNRLIEEGAQLSKAAGSLRLWIQINEFRVPIYCLQGRFPDAMETIESAGQIAIRDGHLQSIGGFRIAKSRLLFLQGKTRDARNYYVDNESAIEASLNFGAQTVSKIAAQGFLTDLYTRNKEWDAALQAAVTLNNLLTHAQTISFALVAEASASIGLYLTLWESQSAKSYSRLADSILKLFHRKYTRHYPIGHPVEYTYRCWYHWLNGNEKQARTVGELAIQTAQTYKMPYYEATARYHLARFMAKDDPQRADQLKTAAALFEAIGSGYDAQRAREAR